MGRIDAIYRYPVKGLTPERLTSAPLAPGSTLPADRRYAIENGPSGFDPAAPKYFPKTKFLMLMKNERLARLKTHYDDATEAFTVKENGAEVAHGDLRTAEGRAVIEKFFAKFCTDELHGPPKILQGGNHSFSDVARKVVSVINLASVAQLENAIGAPVDPLRFRGNIYVSGWPAWHEFELLEKTVALGANARGTVVKRIVRCPATNVDPSTGARDMVIPETLKAAFGHQDCGVYIEITQGGTIAPGDSIYPVG
ncbi:MAG: MOSC domain-containing protein [Xanthobacteraceae bacterium]